MDDLRPDSDEVRRYQQQRGKPVKGGATQKPAKAASPTKKTAQVKGADEEGSAAKPIKVSANGVKEKSYFGVLSSLMVVCLLVGGGYIGWQQHIKISLLEENLLYATDYMKQSKLLMARLEGRVYEADSEIEESGSEFEKQIKFLDSEMKKLWGVAGDTNKKLIKQNRDAAKSASKLATKAQSDLKVLQASTKKANSSIASLNKLSSANGKAIKDIKQKSIVSLEAALTVLKKKEGDLQMSVDSQVANYENLARQLNQVSAELQSQVLAINASLESVTGKLDSTTASSPLDERLKLTESAIESIDASRRQVNQRIVKIEQRLNELQLLARPNP